MIHFTKKTVFVTAVALCNIAFAQNSQLTPSESISLYAGIGKHGTGDLSGFSMSVEYRNQFKKKLFWFASVSSTLHDGELPLVYPEQNGSLIDGSIRYTTGGIQLAGGLGLNFLKTNRHELGIQAGALVRYQSSSYYDELLIVYLAASSYPYPATFFYHRTPQRTIALGGLGSLFYRYSFTKHFLVGFNAGLQGDTNGDVITQLSLSAGRKF